MTTATISTTAKDEILTLVFRSTGASLSSGVVGSMQLFSGSVPATPETTPSGNTFTDMFSLTHSGWAAAADGVATWTGFALDISNDYADDPDVPSFVRLLYDGVADSGSFDLPVGLATSGAACIVDSMSVASGDIVNVTNLTIKAAEYLAGGNSINTALANSMLNAITLKNSSGVLDSTTYLRLGSGESSYQSVLSFYSGQAPSYASDTATGTLLATYTVPNSTELFGAPSSGVIDLTSTVSITPSANGTVGYFRLTKTHELYGTLVLQGAVATDTSQPMTIDSLSFETGVSRSVTSLRVTM